MSELYTLTISLRNCEHQVTLGFESYARLDAAVTSMDTPNPSVTVSDDFAQAATVEKMNIASIEVAAVDRQWEFRNRLRLARAWADRKHQDTLSKTPDLQFLVGQGVDFGR